ncbi:class I SAM-dependent methyltransferase [Streptomyces hundungensis]|uniref:class I SAM-dependent methyltransferase n=1 Tax=Streptomyces hundungensis TaxID=1077946 RepID=UPI0033DE356E
MGSSDVQGRLWGQASEDWLGVERFAVPSYEAVFDLLRIGAGVRLLDVGCGAGLALRMAVERGADVTGLDASEGLLDIARRRLPGADLRQGELEELPYADASFDAVTSFNAVQFAADPVAALRETKRVTAPGGRVAVLTWGDPARCETRHVFEAIAELLPPPPAGAAGPFALSAPGALEALVQRAGLTPEDDGEAEAPFTFPDLDSAVRTQMSAGPFRRAIEVAGEDATREALRKAFAPARQPDGSYRHENVFRYLICR